MRFLPQARHQHLLFRAILHQCFREERAKKARRLDSRQSSPMLRAEGRFRHQSSSTSCFFRAISRSIPRRAQGSYPLTMINTPIQPDFNSGRASSFCLGCERGPTCSSYNCTAVDAMGIGAPIELAFLTAAACHHQQVRSRDYHRRST